MRIAADNAQLHVALGLMRERGGAFARCIEEAYAKADRENKARLRMAFGDLFVSYGADIEERISEVATQDEGVMTVHALLVRIQA